MLAFIVFNVLNAAQSPHIVFILVDDMGYGDPGCFNPASKIPTPNIDRLASEGMRFTDMHSAGAVCHPSRYGLLTGQYPWRVNVGKWPKHAVIDESRPTVASLLKRRNYHTAMVGKWHLGFEENGYENPLPGGPVDRGFDSYFGIRASTDIPPYFYIRNRKAVEPPTVEIAANKSEGWSPIQGAFWREGLIAPDLKLDEVLPRFTREAMGIIETHSKEQADQPLFLYLAFPAPHTPWLPSKEYRGKSGAGMYGDFLVMVDTMIGRVLHSLEETGMADDTLVFFSSDNGPVWYPEDTKRLGHDSTDGLHGMKGDAYEGGHRMPFIAKWPGVVGPGTVSDQTLCFTDLFATLADVVDLSMKEEDGPDSFSFLPVMKGSQSADAPIRSSLVIASSGGMDTIRSGPWKLLQGLGSGGFSQPRRVKPTPDGPQGQLYNLVEDPTESNNLFLKHPEIAKRLEGELRRIQTAKQSRP